MQDIYGLLEGLAKSISDKDAKAVDAYTKWKSLSPHSSNKVHLQNSILEDILCKDLNSASEAPPRTSRRLAYPLSVGGEESNDDEEVGQEVGEGGNENTLAQGKLNIGLLPAASRRTFQVDAVSKLYWELLSHDKDDGVDILKAADSALAGILRAPLQPPEGDQPAAPEQADIFGEL
eukprot:3201716-Pyramimonas_sp.AAC.1